MNASKIKFPETLVEAVRIFSDLDYATNFFASIRWPGGVCCPRCGSTNVLYMAKRRMWECRETHEKKQFSVKIGTIFEECRLPIDKCLIAVWLEVNAKNSISSYEVARHLGVTQKTGWFLLHRIRFGLKAGSFDAPLGGIGSVGVEVDETYVGGLAKNMHRAKRAGLRGTGGIDKAAVMGVLERSVVKVENGKRKVTRHSKVIASVIPNAQSQTLKSVVYQNVAKGSEVFTDAHRGYFGLSAEYIHGVVDHAQKYVDGKIHTNGLENFWSLFKRCIKGTHVSVEPFHLQAYIDSEVFRFNHRKMEDGGRFLGALKGTPGKRLTYKGLMGDSSLEGYSPSGNDGGGSVQ